jgi:hypothetical protein
MRTFHTGGVGVFSDQALKPFHIYIPFISEEQWKHFLSMIEKLQKDAYLGY